MSKSLKFGLMLVLSSGPIYAAQTKLECLYVIDGVHHVAKIDLSDSGDEQGYKILSIVNNGLSCKDYASGSPKTVNGKKYLRYLLDCGDSLGLFALYEGKQESKWLLTRTFSLIGSPFTMDYECRIPW